MAEDQEVDMGDDLESMMLGGALGAKKKGNILPVWGNEKTMNLNNMVLTNILQSPYYKVHLAEIKTYHEVLDQIYNHVNHLEPWERGSRKTSGQIGMCGGVRGVGAGGIVSSAFCLLYRLFTLKITRKQLNGLINHEDSPYIRGIGFMYIRFCQPPADLWEWLEAYLDDAEEVDPKAGTGDPMTMGMVVQQLLTRLDWYGTLFPRIPVPIQKQIDQKLKDKRRDQQNERFARRNEDDARREQMRRQSPEREKDNRRRSRSPVRRRSPSPPRRESRKPEDVVRRDNRDERRRSPDRARRTERRSSPPARRPSPPARRRSPSPPNQGADRRSAVGRPDRDNGRRSPDRRRQESRPERRRSPDEFSALLEREKKRQEKDKSEGSSRKAMDDVKSKVKQSSSRSEESDGGHSSDSSGTLRRKGKEKLERHKKHKSSKHRKQDREERPAAESDRQRSRERTDKEGRDRNSRR